MSWTVELIFHWPHDRLAVGFEALRANEEIPWSTYQVFLGILTLRVNTWEEEDE